MSIISRVFGVVIVGPGMVLLMKLVWDWECLGL